MNVSDIFLVAAESKDKHCLDPIVDHLKGNFDSVYNIDFSRNLDEANKSTLISFAKSTFPIVILSSVGILNALTLIRPRHTFICIGLEHGIAPFKTYTYGKHLLSSDFYIAPTKGWAERLARLYPETRSQIRLGGYPKIEAIRERTVLPKALGEHGPERLLVILSWGVSEKAFEFLPDEEFIDYVLHPADWKLEQRISLSKAKVHVSNPNATYDLISSASIVIGDFSSLTLECIHLGKHVIFMVDRTIYDGDCDLDPAFMDNGNPEFGIIPESNCRIAVDSAISAEEFSSLVTMFGDDIHGFKSATTRATFDEAFLPPIGADNRHLCVAEICKVLDLVETWPNPVDYSSSSAVNAVELLSFISSAYHSILGRRVDGNGLQHYFQKLSGLEGGNLFKAISVWHEISGSNEAKLRSYNAREFPRIHFPTSDPLKSANTSAAEERLLDALYWITKAIEHHPEHGEYLRFKASILERMGRFDEALDVAKEAEARGADVQGIAADIERIDSRIIAELKAGTRSSEAAVSLASYSRLLAMNKLSFRDTMNFAGKLIKSYATAN